MPFFDYRTMIFSAALQKDKLFKEVEQQWNTVSSEEGNSRRKVDYEIYKKYCV